MYDRRDSGAGVESSASSGELELEGGGGRRDLMSEKSSVADEST